MFKLQMNSTRTQSSILLNVNDPIQMHLLLETALGDSKEFEILSQEEVDELKKQVQSLTQRIAQTQQNLAIQSKYRDAAISMAKLYSPADKNGSDPKKPRRSLLGHRSSNSDQVREADLERLASERRCEELAQELWNLEKRLMEPQKRLLQHTAGILQMTHKGPARQPRMNGVTQQGIPGSPESMYTYTNARSSIDPVNEEDFFDERSLYRSFDRLDGLGLGGSRESYDAQGRSASRSPAKSREQVSESIRTIAKAEQKLDDLNNQLREVIVRANPEREASYARPPHVIKNDISSEPGKVLALHLDYLEQCIKAIDDEQRILSDRQQETDAQNSLEKIEAVVIGLWDNIQSGEADIRQRKLQFRQMRSTNDSNEEESDRSGDEMVGNFKEPFSLQTFSSKVQSLYSRATSLKDQKEVLQRQIKQQRELNSKSDKTRDAQLTEMDVDLKRTQSALQKAENDAKNMQTQLMAVMERLDEARRDITQRELEKTKKDATDSAALQAVRATLLDRNDEIIRLEEELQDLKDDQGIGNAELQSKLKDMEGRVQELTAELAEAGTLKAVLSGKETEMENMNMEIARLQTEVTIARAELDGAYGSRAQRAAEVAANPAIQKEIDDLLTRNRTLQAELETLRSTSESSGGESRVQELKRELSETIEEYEVMTKASIEWEKEREGLEREIDKLRDEREALEARLSDEQVRWLGMKSPGTEGAAQGVGAGSTSTMVLKNEFKKMMRDTRAENAKALRVSIMLLILLCSTVSAALTITSRLNKQSGDAWKMNSVL